MKLFSKLSDRTAEQLIGGKNDKWEIPEELDDPNTPEQPLPVPPGLNKNLEEDGKVPNGLFKQGKQPQGWSQGF